MPSGLWHSLGADAELLSPDSVDSAPAFGAGRSGFLAPHGPPWLSEASVPQTVEQRRRSRLAASFFPNCHGDDDDQCECDGGDVCIEREGDIPSKGTYALGCNVKGTARLDQFPKAKKYLEFTGQWRVDEDKDFTITSNQGKLKYTKGSETCELVNQKPAEEDADKSEGFLICAPDSTAKVKLRFDREQGAIEVSGEEKEKHVAYAREAGAVDRKSALERLQAKGGTWWSWNDEENGGVHRFHIETGKPNKSGIAKLWYTGPYQDGSLTGGMKLDNGTTDQAPADDANIVWKGVIDKYEYVMEYGLKDNTISWVRTDKTGAELKHTAHLVRQADQMRCVELANTNLRRDKVKGRETLEIFSHSNMAQGGKPLAKVRMRYAMPRLAEIVEQPQDPAVVAALKEEDPEAEPEAVRKYEYDDAIKAVLLEKTFDATSARTLTPKFELLDREEWLSSYKFQRKPVQALMHDLHLKVKEMKRYLEMEANGEVEKDGASSAATGKDKGKASDAAKNNGKDKGNASTSSGSTAEKDKGIDKGNATTTSGSDAEKVKKIDPDKGKSPNDKDARSKEKRHEAERDTDPEGQEGEDAQEPDPDRPEYLDKYMAVAKLWDDPGGCMYPINAGEECPSTAESMLEAVRLSEKKCYSKCMYVKGIFPNSDIGKDEHPDTPMSKRILQQCRNVCTSANEPPWSPPGLKAVGAAYITSVFSIFGRQCEQMRDVALSICTRKDKCGPPLNCYRGGEDQEELQQLLKMIQTRIIEERKEWAEAAQNWYAENDRMQKGEGAGPDDKPEVEEVPKKAVGQNSGQIDTPATVVAAMPPWFVAMPPPLFAAPGQRVVGPATWRRCPRPVGCATNVAQARLASRTVAFL